MLKLTISCCQWWDQEPCLLWWVSIKWTMSFIRSIKSHIHYVSVLPNSGNICMDWKNHIGEIDGSVASIMTTSHCLQWFPYHLSPCISKEIHNPMTTTLASHCIIHMMLIDDEVFHLFNEAVCNQWSPTWRYILDQRSGSWANYDQLLWPIVQILLVDLTHTCIAHCATHWRCIINNAANLQWIITKHGINKNLTFDFSLQTCTKIMEMHREPSIWNC